MTTGEKIRSRRRAMNRITIAGLAERAGWSATHMLDIEADRASPRLSELTMLAIHLDCEIRDLLDDPM